MIVRSDFPHLRCYSPGLLNRLNLILHSPLLFGDNLYGSLSLQGLRNVLKIKSLISSLGMFVDNKLYGNHCSSVARLASCFSVEAMLSPSNLRSDCFNYISGLIPDGVEEQTVLISIKCYFSLCHLIGSLVCFSWGDLRSLLVEGGFSEEHAGIMLNVMKLWWIDILKRSSKSLNRNDLFIEDCEMSECAVAACLAVYCYKLVLVRMRLMDTATYIKAIDSCMELLLKKCVPVWLKVGGPHLCLVKILSLLSVIKSAVVSGCASVPENTMPHSSVRMNILGCFKTRCIGCHINSSNSTESVGIASCRKEIICCTSSSDLLCNMTASILNDENPLEVTKRIVSEVVNTDCLECLNPSQKKIVKILLSVGAKALKHVGLCKLSTLALRKVTVSEYMRVFHAVNFEASMIDKCSDDGIYLGELIYVSCGQMTLDWGASHVSGMSKRLRRWCECIVMGCDNIRLDRDRLLGFVYFVKNCCIFSAHSDCVKYLITRLEQYINDYYSADSTDSGNDSLAGLVSALVCCVLILGTDDFVVLNVWMRKSLEEEDGGPAAKRTRLEARNDSEYKICFPEFFVNGILVLPNEING